MERAARILAAERPEESLEPGGVEGAADLPEVLVDRDQVADALSRLLGNAAHRAGGLGKVRVKLEETEAVGERGVRTGAFVRVDVLFPREEITEEDLHPDEDRRRAATTIGARTWPPPSSSSRPTVDASSSPTSGPHRAPGLGPHSGRLGRGIGLALTGGRTPDVTNGRKSAAASA